MKLRLRKKEGGQAGITVVRDDGTVTHGQLGTNGFGAVHDLAHHVVETMLPLSSGFYGLLAQGWDIPDFEIKGTAKQLPDEAIAAECLVGQLVYTVFGGQSPAADDFNRMVDQAVKGIRPAAAAPAVGEDLLRDMRARLDELVAHWRALPPGETLELAVALSPASRPPPARGPVRRGGSPTLPPRGA